MLVSNFRHRETMEIRTKHLGAGFEASFKESLEGLKGMENCSKINMIYRMKQS